MIRKHKWKKKTGWTLILAGLAATGINQLLDGPDLISLGGAYTTTLGTYLTANYQGMKQYKRAHYHKKQY